MTILLDVVIGWEHCNRLVGAYHEVSAWQGGHARYVVLLEGVHSTQINRVYTTAEVLMTADVTDSLRCAPPGEKKDIRDRMKEHGCPSAREAMQAFHGPFTDNFITNAEIAFRGIVATAIRKGRRILFYYRAFDPYMRPTRKHDGKRYSVSPCDCHFAKETFYMIGADADEEKLKIFRLDRMEEMECAETLCTEPPSKYIEGDSYREILRMREEMVDHFDGEEVMLELDIYYSPEAMEIVHDLAGKRVTVPRYDKQSNISHAFFRVRRGATLTGWLLQNHKFVKATAPQSVIDDVREALKKYRHSRKRSKPLVKLLYFYRLFSQTRRV